MLEKFRQWSGSWIAKILLGILVLSFGLFFGMTDIFQGQHPLAVVATVGKEELLTQELRRRIEQQLHFLEQASGQRFSPEQVAQLNIPVRVLAQMINESFIDQEVEKMNLTITDEQIRDAIQNDSHLQDDKGVFSRALFERFLHAQSVSEKTYVALLRKQLKRSQLVEALLAPLQVPPSLATLLLDAQFQKRYGAYVLIQGKDQRVNDIPDEKTLQAFYNQYPFLFKVPEKRSFTFLRIEVLGTEDEKAHQEALYALSKKVDDALASGETFEEVAKTNGLSLTHINKISREGVLENGKVDDRFLSNKTFSQLMLEQVFASEAKADTPVMRTPEGEPFVVRVDEVFPENTPAFKEVQARVREVWFQAQQNILAQKAAEVLAQDIALGNTPAKGLIPLKALSLKEKDGVPEAVFDVLFTLAPGEVRAIPAATGAYVVRLLRLQQPTSAETKKYRTDFEQKIAQMLKDDLLQGYLQNLKPLYPIKLNQKALQAAF